MSGRQVRLFVFAAAVAMAGCGGTSALGQGPSAQAGWLYQGPDPYGNPSVLYMQWIRHDNNLTGFVQQFTPDGSSPNPNNRIPLTGAINGSLVIVSVTNLFSSSGTGTMSDGTLTLDFPRSHLILHRATSSDYDQAVNALQPSSTNTTSSPVTTTTTAPPTTPPTAPSTVPPLTTVPQVACTGSDGATYMFNSTSIPPGYSNCRQQSP